MRTQFVAFAVRWPLALGVCLAIGGVMSLGVRVASSADRDIVNSAGFELPAFTTTFLGTGQLEGQINPVGFGQAISPGQWLRPVGVQTGIGKVQAAVVKSGSQAVQIDRVGNSSDRWGIPVNSQAYPEYPADRVPPGETAQPCLCINWDMLVRGPAGNVMSDFGPYFGVEANDDDVIGLSLLGSLGVDGTTGEVLYQAPVTGSLTPAGPVASFHTWHNYQIKLDYSTHEYTILFDTVPLGTFAFVDGPEDQFSEANIIALAASGAPADLARTGTAFFDNFLVREGGCNVIPEPSTVLLTIFGLALLPGLVSRQRSAN
jgi:hypothetical protein